MERPIPIKDLNLGVFDPRTGHEQLSHFAVDNGLIPVDDSHLSVKALVQASRTKPLEYFMSGVGKKIQDRANKAVYGAIEEKYDLMEGAGKGFWKKQWHAARSQVQSLVHEYARDDKSIFGFLNEIDIQPTPAEVIRYISEEPDDPRLRFETTRQGALALISAELDTKARKAEERLKEADQWLDIDVFNDRTHRPKIQSVWALHDDTTNAVVRIDRASEDHAPEEGKHWKEHGQRMRYAGDSIGWVTTNGRVKEGGINKTVKKALQRKGEARHFDPDSDVPDMMGMQFVVKDEDLHDGEKVRLLSRRIQRSLHRRFPDNKKGLPTVTFTEKPPTGNETQSGKFQAYRLMAKFSDMDTPLELMFHGMKDELTNRYELGEPNAETGKPDGAAWEITDASRSILLMEKVYFPTYPPEAPDEDKFYGTPDWERTRRRVFKSTAIRLRNARLPHVES